MSYVGNVLVTGSFDGTAKVWDGLEHRQGPKPEQKQTQELQERKQELQERQHHYEKGKQGRAQRNEEQKQQDQAKIGFQKQHGQHQLRLVATLVGHSEPLSGVKLIACSANKSNKSRSVVQQQHQQEEQQQEQQQEQEELVVGAITASYDGTVRIWALDWAQV
jgi:WD40 repeat protein